MKWACTPERARRASFLTCLALAFVMAVAPASAFTTVHFIDLQSEITNDIAALLELENPTREQRNLLRSLSHATSVLARDTASDGKTLRGVNSILGRYPSCIPALSTTASNLLLAFNAKYAFVGTLLAELPPSPEATAVVARYNALAPFVEKLNAAPKIAKFSALYDAAMRRLDAVFAEATEALIVPFPVELSPNSVKARINGVTFSASSGSSSENSFSAVVTETNIIVTLRAVNSSRGLHLSMPNVQAGTFRYVIPESGVFTNRTNISYYPPFTETQSGATEGTIFISTTPTEVYGIFSCSGPDFNVALGRFRITISSQP